MGSTGIMLVVVGLFIIGHVVWGDWSRKAWGAIA